MLGWFKKKAESPARPIDCGNASSTVPPAASGVPEKGKPPPELPAVAQEKPTHGKLFLRGPHGDVAVEFDLIQSAAKMLRKCGHQVTCHEKWIVHEGSGLIIEPRLDGLDLQPRGMHTVTTMAVRHPLIKAKRVFEYQHSAGDQLVETLEKGFDLWVQGDLPVLLDALSATPKVCTRMELTLPAKGNEPPKKRRAILGPVGHLQAQKQAVEEEHPFCACCFFTRTGKSFQHVMNNDGFYAIRYFGMRDENGIAGADCRINGEEFEEGKAAVRAYVATWPGTGFEIRKQYVIWQDWPDGAQ